MKLIDTLLRPFRIMSAANMLRDIDRRTGERTVGYRGHEARRCAEACGLTVANTAEGQRDETVDAILRLANS